MLRDGAEKLIENIDTISRSGTRPDRPARRKTSPVKDLDGDWRAAFISPSFGRVNQTPPLQTPGHPSARQRRIDYDLAHRSGSRAETRTKRLSDCGTRAETSTTRRSFAGGFGCIGCVD